MTSPAAPSGGSAAAAGDGYFFKVQVLEGRGFGEEPQALLCCAAFAGDSKSTQYSVSTDAHVWNCSLTWRVSKDELRKAQASGSSHCKLTVLRKDGSKLGWAVVSLRSAKLQSQYKSDPTGKWLQLNASKLTDPPQLRELIGFLTGPCSAKLPPKLTPLRTLPAVDVLRGSEAALPNGCGSVDFAAGVMGLAGLLAAEPRVVLEVWHREKLRADLLLGVASVSLSALLQECWVDGYAPVYAMMARADGGDERQEQVQVGLLRVVLSLEDKVLGAVPGDFRQMPEYLVAWELEVWKKAEEARFRAQLKELEQQRMSVIEQQWWKRERAREAEAAALKAEYGRLEQQTKALLAAVQEREAKLLSAEADLARRRADLERQQAGRMSEAEAAVRRLQVECEHQLSLERDRTAAVARQRDAAESRLLAAEARAAALEAQFSEYRSAQRDTPEAQLQLQLQEVQAAAARAEDRAARAIKLKKQYKQQVLQLAREMAALHQQRQAEALQQLEQQQAAAAAQEQNSLAAAQQAELSTVKEQLAQLKAAALASAVAAAAAAAASPSRGSHGSDKVRRLLKEKVELIASGLYARDDPVVLQIDARVQALAEQQLSA
ncbi:hypothetical protein OEZ85_000765 [Tetradesmus obliquus]|uniref:C2 domain-containing protein n=1 Tax=Tetradesmus obliquus TaxID=3088 RepID=A0ABY8UPP4_TETOB|nr:hypothetical protein OEZ85_000765 [Tetradesmus obliquus]